MLSDEFCAERSGIAVGRTRDLLLGRPVTAGCDVSIEHLKLMVAAGEHSAEEDATERFVPLRMAGNEVTSPGDLAA